MFRGPPPAQGDRIMRPLSVLVCTLALAACQRQEPSPVPPPPDPPSGEIRPEAPIPYATLAEHLSFNTKSRVQVLCLIGRVIEVRGPVWKVEREGDFTVLRLGTARGSVVRALFRNAGDLKDVREGQQVSVAGTFAFRGSDVILENAHRKQ
jgi:hypothetical protein